MDSLNTRFQWGFVVALLLAFASLSGATSRDLQEQVIGTDICFCAPNTYEFTLDFSLTCPPVNITLGDAVNATTCMVSPTTTMTVEDLVPVSVQTIEVLELNQKLQVWSQEVIEPMDDFLDGDTFSYTSYAAIPGDIVKPEDLPRAIQLNINGANSLCGLLLLRSTLELLRMRRQSHGATALLLLERAAASLTLLLASTHVALPSPQRSCATLGCASYRPSLACQCAAECPLYGNCCADYVEVRRSAPGQRPQRGAFP